MQSLKNLVINAAMSWALLFGLTVSATAAELSFEEVKARAEQGDSLYQGYLGTRYDKGQGVRQDYSKAFYWYQRGAHQGEKFSQTSMGYAYLFGEGVRQDYSKALEWFKKAAKQDYNIAQNQIGTMYKYGKGVRQNNTTAKEWYGKACDNGLQSGCDQYRILNEQGY